MICSKTMKECTTQSMCAPFGGCQPLQVHTTDRINAERYVYLRDFLIHQDPNSPLVGFMEEFGNDAPTVQQFNEAIDKARRL